MLRVLGILLAVVIGLGGFMAIDFTTASRAASAEDGEGLTFRDYIGKLPGRMMGEEKVQSVLPPTLAEMLPDAPDGWTMRPALKTDAADFLPRDSAEGSADVRKYVSSVSEGVVGLGSEQVIQTYERGRSRVIFQVVRFPDPNEMLGSLVDAKLQIAEDIHTAKYRPTAFMTVRGMDVIEDLLPEGIRVRYFLASVGGQIQIKVLASRRLSDEELIPFFETLDVKAMNASVGAKQDGLGEVPVIVLASALDKATRDAYEAARKPAVNEADAAAIATDVSEGASKITMDSNKAGPNEDVTCIEKAGTKFCTIGDGQLPTPGE